MGRGKRTQKAVADEVENIENEDRMEMDQAEESVTPARRASKFVEATMNSRSSIRPPPDEQWEALGIDHLIQGFHDENSAPPAASKRSVSRTTSSSAVPTESSSSGTGSGVDRGAHDGPFGRFSRAVASFFGGPGANFSLGKRKAGNENAEGNANVPGSGITTRTPGGTERASDAKERAEAAYAEAMAKGLLPTPKIFVRPVSRARRPGVPVTSTPGAVPPTPTSSMLAIPRTPTLYKSPSKKDLQKQKKLSKRVSDLEHKLASARKELALTLSSANANIDPVPPMPTVLSSPPPTSSPLKQSPLKQAWSANIENAAEHRTSTEAPCVGKIVKKRKAILNDDDDAAYRPIPTDSDFSHESEHESKRTKATSAPKLKRKASSRLLKKKTTTFTREEEVVMVVPDARVGVPPIPSIPQGVDGKRSPVKNPDGYGGLEHEMF